MDSEARAQVAVLEASEQGSASPDVEELLEGYRPLVRKVAGRWGRLWPAQYKDIAQEITLTLWQVLQRRPDAPLNYLTAVANQAASKYLSRGVSVDRPLRLKRRRHWEMVSLELLSTSEEDGEFVPQDKVRRHHHVDEWASVVEDLVVARLLYLDIHGRLSRMERRVLRAGVLGYRNGEIAALLGLTYSQVKRARSRIAAKARSLWDRHMA